MASKFHVLVLFLCLAHLLHAQPKQVPLTFDVASQLLVEQLEAFDFLCKFAVAGVDSELVVLLFDQLILEKLDLAMQRLLLGLQFEYLLLVVVHQAVVIGRRLGTALVPNYLLLVAVTVVVAALSPILLNRLLGLRCEL